MDLNERIRNYIILASAVNPDIGLINGKMGIMLFLMQYAKLSGNGVYKEIADDLLDEVWGEVTVASPAGFASGLCGIGWGIEYLVQNGFVEGDADEICEEVDRAVRLQKIHSEMDRSLDTGLEGILHYVMARIGGNRLADHPIPFDAMLLEELYGLTKNKKTGIFALFNRFYTGSPYEYPLNLADFIPARIRVKKILAENTLGLRGLTGYLFKQLT